MLNRSIAYKKIIKFGIAGLINTGIDWAFYFLFSKLLGQSEMNAKLIGAVGGVTSAYVLNALWVFREDYVYQFSKQGSRRQKLKFIWSRYFKMVAAYSVGLLVNVAAFTLCIKLVFPEFISLIVATLLSFNINFLLSKKYVFSRTL